MLWLGRDFVNGQIGSFIFVLFVQAQAHCRLQATIHNETSDDGNADADPCADELRHESHTANTTQSAQPENSSGDATPGAGEPMQGPDT